MVKKVIDIMPPADRNAERKFEETDLEQNALLEPDDLPVKKIEPQIKPRMTFINRMNPDGRQNSEKIKEKSFFKGLILKLALAVAFVALAMYGLDLKFAKAIVKIWPATSILRQDVKVGVDPATLEINREKNLIPGFAISVSNTIKGEFPVTGKKDVQGMAQGTVKLFNNYTTAQRLVKGTRLQAPLDKFQPALAGDETPWFKTTEDVVLEPKSSTTVKVVAAIAGEKYNIDASVFSVPGLVGTAQYTFVYGQSFEKFTGGSQNSAPEVKKEDIDNAKIAMADLAKEEIEKELQAKVKEQGLEIVDASVEKFELGTTTIIGKAGDSIAKIGGQMMAKASTVAYKKSDLEKLSKDFITGKIPAGSFANEKSLAIKSSYAGIDPANGKPSLSAAAEVMIYSGMGEADLKKGLSEKGLKEAQLFLMSQPGMKDAQIQLSPPWRLNVPRELDRIEVQTILE
ncbi:MAG: hypothetical protein WA093_00375 [Minisyncoccales bacterium]